VLPFAAMSATSEAPAAFRHAAARPGPLRLIGEAIEDIRSRRRLVRYLVQADIKKKGADTLLGNFWWILDPLLQMGVYVVFVSLILDVKTKDYPLFVLAAILPWKWFTTSVADAASSVVSQEKLIKQIQFPKLVLPVAATTAGVVGFAFGLLPLAGIMLLYQDRISPFLVLIPVIAVVQYVFTLGVSFLVSAVNVFFRDLGNILRHFLRLWFYLSPALYSLSILDSSATFQQNPVLRTLAHANPFAVLFESYRAVIYGEPDGSPHAPDWLPLIGLLGASVVLLAIGAILFKRLEPTFAKVL
jgi:lipopolysaccharide transport system permease protein